MDKSHLPEFKYNSNYPRNNFQKEVQTNPRYKGKPENYRHDFKTSKQGNIRPMRIEKKLDEPKQSQKKDAEMKQGNQEKEHKANQNYTERKQFSS